MLSGEDMFVESGTLAQMSPPGKYCGHSDHEAGTPFGHVVGWPIGIWPIWMVQLHVSTRPLILLLRTLL